MKKIAASLFLLIMMVSAAFAEDVSVTTGAGYMKMAKELCAAYKEMSGRNVQEMYGGNVGQQLAQIEAGSGVNVIISDIGTLDSAKTNVKFDTFVPIGKTVLVLAWRKGISLSSPNDLLSDNVKSVCYPDPKAAIYGRAAASFLKSSGIEAKIPDKISQMSTVPQVFSYLVSGEMDAGFVNRVVVRAGKEKIGGFLEIENGYPPLNMVAAVVKGEQSNPEVKSFIDFLKTEKGKAILKKHGVW
ncbi:MAG: molybdate ABC transporter substrate-binding protein [Synergistaceae bacterium]|nr:molybdate ABC transporter substrate-binding protein [Synergistaceae bacterium]